MSEVSSRSAMPNWNSLPSGRHSAAASDVAFVVPVAATLVRMDHHSNSISAAEVTDMTLLPRQSLGSRASGDETG
jgi:hypothetical protein